MSKSTDHAQQNATRMAALRYFTPAELNALYQAIVHALTSPYLSFSVERNLRSAREKITHMLKALSKQ